MDHRITTLTGLAQQALDQYKADMAAGGEPVYPQWARDLQDILAAYEKLVTAVVAAEELHKVGIFNAADGQIERVNQLRGSASAAAGAA